MRLSEWKWAYEEERNEPNYPDDDRPVKTGITKVKRLGRKKMR